MRCMNHPKPGLFFSNLLIAQLREDPSAVSFCWCLRVSAPARKGIPRVQMCGRGSCEGRACEHARLRRAPSPGLQQLVCLQNSGATGRVWATARRAWEAVQPLSRPSRVLAHGCLRNHRLPRLPRVGLWAAGSPNLNMNKTYVCPKPLFFGQRRACHRLA